MRATRCSTRRRRRRASKSWRAASSSTSHRLRAISNQAATFASGFATMAPASREEVKAHLFEPFVTTKAPGHGTGLGLAVSLAMVRERAGDVTLDVSDARGTSFSAYLPELKRSASDRSKAPDTKPSRARVLVLDDEEPVRLVVYHLLTSAGYDVETAGSEQEALGVLEKAAVRRGAARSLHSRSPAARFGAHPEAQEPPLEESFTSRGSLSGRTSSPRWTACCRSRCPRLSSLERSNAAVATRDGDRGALASIRRCPCAPA